jgi:hypothetical protein
MSQRYKIHVQIRGYDVTQKALIKRATTAEWPFRAWSDMGGAGDSLQASGESSMYAGEYVDDLAHRITEAIWIANGAKCSVDVFATHLPPHESFHFNADNPPEHRCPVPPGMGSRAG